MDKFVIALDPGIKYVGVAYGRFNQCRGVQLDLHQSLETPLSISEQHWDLIQHIDHWRNKDAHCEIVLETPSTMSGMDISDESYENLSKLSIICDELVKKISVLTEADGYALSIHDGATTKARRRELGINKTIFKNHKNIMAHINDARALWSLPFAERYSQHNPLPKLPKPKYIDYETWNKNLVEKLVDPFKTNILNRSLRLLEIDNTVEINNRLNALCSKNNIYKSDILKLIEDILTSTLEEKTTDNKCEWLKTRYSNVFHNTNCGKVLKYNSTHSSCPSCNRNLIKL